MREAQLARPGVWPYIDQQHHEDAEVIRQQIQRATNDRRCWLNVEPSMIDKILNNKLRELAKPR